MASLIGHEIAHSWTGNLVTNKNFEHFWLNEGFTTFSERKIEGRLYGESYRHFKAIGGWKDLAYAVRNCEKKTIAKDSILEFLSQVEVLGETNPFTSLVVDLSGVDPDDAYSLVPYEKGSSFLWHLEEKVGGSGKKQEKYAPLYTYFLTQRCFYLRP